MRKIMLMASMLAMVMLAASPALAQTQTANPSNTQEGTTSGGGDVVNNASNVVQQCQSGQYSELSPVQCSQIVNLVQAGEDAAQAVNQVVNQNQNAAGAQYQYGDQTPSAPNNQAPNAPADVDDVVAQVGDVNEDGVADVADVVAQVDANEDGVVDVAEAEAVDSQATADAIASASAFASADAEAAAVASADAVAGADAEDSSVAVLPDTGGASLFTLGAGALLVAGGLLARRIVR